MSWPVIQAEYLITVCSEFSAEKGGKHKPWSNIRGCGPLGMHNVYPQHFWAAVKTSQTMKELTVAIPVSWQPLRICLKTPWTALSGWTIPRRGRWCYRSPESSRRWTARRGNCQCTVPLPPGPHSPSSSRGGGLDGWEGLEGREGGREGGRSWLEGSHTRAFVVTASRSELPCGFSVSGRGLRICLCFSGIRFKIKYIY